MKFQMKRRELLRACRYIAGRMLRKRRAFLFAAGILLLFVAATGVLSGNLTTLGDFVGILAALLLLGWLFLTLMLFFSVQKSIRQGQIEILVEDGMIRRRTCRNTLGWPLRDLTVIKEHGGILYIGREMMKQEQFMLIPVRVFPDRQQKEAFIKLLRSGCTEGGPEESSDVEKLPPLYEYAWPVGPEDLAENLYALGLWLRTQGQRKRTSVLLYGLCCASAFLVWRDSGSLLSCLLKTLFLTVGFYSCFLTDITQQRYRRMIGRSSAYQTLLGDWTVRFYENRVELTQNRTRNVFSWQYIHEMVEFEHIFLFCTEKHQQVLFLPKNALSEETRKAFLDFCRAKCIYRNYADTNRKWKPVSVPLKLGLLLLLSVVLFAGFRLQSTVMGYAGGDSMPKYSGYGEIYDASGSVRSIPVREQAEILRELGLEVSEETVELYEAYIAEEPDLASYVEEWPFYELLMEAAAPERNSDTWEINRYSDQAYWFDFEGWDISTDYLEILRGVEAISGGALSFTELEVDDSRVNWEYGTGRILIRFCLNGEPHKYTAKMEHDWIDPNFLTYLMKLTGQVQSGKRLYICSDMGQGCILFYRDSNWADRFMQKTGILLEAN